MPGEFYVENKAEKVDLAEIKNLISQLQTNITQVQGDVTSIVTSAGRQLSSMDFWSGTLEEVQLNGAGATVALPGVTVSGIPTGATMLRTIAITSLMAEQSPSPARLYRSAMIPPVHGLTLSALLTTSSVWRLKRGRAAMSASAASIFQASLSEMTATSSAGCSAGQT